MESYRGMTLSSVVTKVLEFLVLERLQMVFLEASIPYPNQSAYRKRVSCGDAIFSTQEVKNQKEFWKVVKFVNSKTNSIPILVSETSTAASNVDKANLLNVTFVSNFNYSLPGLAGQFLSDAPHSCPTDLLCTEDEVFNMLSTLDTTKANGHDDISARMLRETATSVTPYVTKLFNTSIRLGELPDE